RSTRRSAGPPRSSRATCAPRRAMANGVVQAARLSVPRRRRSGRRLARHKSTIAFLMALPLIALIAALVIYPALYSLHLATLNKSMEPLVGLDAVPWLGEPLWARFSVILVNVWYGAPFFLIMYLAALKSVPEQLYEAAAIDGANWWQKIWYITLPMMRNIIAITVLFSLIVTFANFDIVRILTNGGPIDQTHVFATWAFQLVIEGGDLPLGACVSLFMFPILGVAAYFILRDINRRR